MPRVSPSRYEKVTLAAVVVLSVIIVTGGAVRVTGSGLGCPDWPTCAEGSLIPPNSFHGWVESVNRYFTGLVVVVVVVGVLSSLLRAPRRRDLTLYSISLVVGVLAQAVLGGFTVLWGLNPYSVMAHFLLSQVVLWSALVLYRRARQPDGVPHPVVHKDYVWLGRALFVLAAAVLVAGTVVTGSGPHGGDVDVPRLGFEPHDVTRVHGVLVWALLFVTVLTVWRLHAAGADKSLVRKGEVVMATLLVQGALGYLQYALGVPAVLVLFHIAGATAVWIAVVWFNLSFWERWEPSGLTAYDSGPLLKEADSEPARND